MLTPTPAPVGLALLAFTVKPTSLIVLKGECVSLFQSWIIIIMYFTNLLIDTCITTEYDIKKIQVLNTIFLMSAALASMEGHAQIKSTAIPVPAAQVSLAPIVSTRSMSVTPSHA